MTRILHATAAGLAGILLGIGGFSAGNAALALAATSQPKPQTYCERFVIHLARDLGKKESEIRAALAQSAAETVADAAKAGDLSPAQAERLKAHLAKQPLCAEHVGALKGHQDRLHFYMVAYRLAAAKALGMTAGQLQAELAKGATLHQLADSSKLTEADFRTALMKSLTARLDREVRRARLTQAQEAQILEHLRSGELPLWDHTFSRTLAPDLN